MFGASMVVMICFLYGAIILLGFGVIVINCCWFSNNAIMQSYAIMLSHAIMQSYAIMHCYAIMQSYTIMQCYAV